MWGLYPHTREDLTRWQVGFFIITSRKRGFHIFYTAQYKAMVDKVLREVTTDVVYCMKLPFGFGLRFYHPQLEVEVYRFRKSIFQLYDTTSGFRRRGVSFEQVVDEALRRTVLSLKAKRALLWQAVEFQQVVRRVDG